MPDSSQVDISALLLRHKNGDEKARSQLFSALQQELRSYASRLMHKERCDHTLNTSALINEACVRMLEQQAISSASNQRHLLGIASNAMRQVLVDHARGRNAEKRGGQAIRQPTEYLDRVIDHFETTHAATLLDLDRALNSLATQSQRQVDIVQLRFFSGLTVAEIANIVGCSAKTVEADWRVARAKLYRMLKQ